MTYNVAVIGADNLVGFELLELLELRDFPIADLFPLNTHEYHSELIRFKGVDKNVLNIERFDFSNIDIAFFCDDVNLFHQYSHKIPNAFIVSQSINEKLPIIIPQINSKLISNSRSQIIRNPISISVQISLAIYELNKKYKIKRIIASSYQSVSSFGKSAIKELYNQTKKTYENDSMKASIFEKRIAFNVIPKIGDYEENHNTHEENRIISEVHAILGEKIPLSINCVTVPVFKGDAVSLNIEFENNITVKDIIDLMSEYDYISISDHETIEYATPIEVPKMNEILISRIRNDESCKNALNMWIVCDNIRAGNALNLVKIAEEFVNKIGE